MVHHTYANILSDDVEDYEKALEHRRIALSMEPAAWVYQDKD